MPSDNRRQYIAFAAVSLGAATATAILYPAQRAFFQPYFGNIDPLLAIALAAFLGGVSLRFLHSRGWISIYPKESTSKGIVLSTLIAMAFAIAMISVDSFIGFPRNLNVPAPWSVLFYPAMAYVVETCFHAFPLALLLALWRKFFEAPNRSRLVWIFIVIVSVIEPIFQLRAGLSGQSLLRLDALVGIHVFAFNLLQLSIFRRYGFVAMLSLRLAYYLFWHIIWGYVRLQLLF